MATDMIARAMAGNTKKELDNYKNNPDVVDVVQNKATLDAYDTSKLTENDLVKVLDDESKEHMQTYYKWVNNDWSYSGGLGPKADLTNNQQEITADKIKINEIKSISNNEIKTTYTNTYIVDDVVASTLGYYAFKKISRDNITMKVDYTEDGGDLNKDTQFTLDRDRARLAIRDYCYSSYDDDYYLDLGDGNANITYVSGDDDDTYTHYTMGTYAGKMSFFYNDDHSGYSYESGLKQEDRTHWYFLTATYDEEEAEAKIDLQGAYNTQKITLSTRYKDDGVNNQNKVELTPTTFTHNGNEIIDAGNISNHLPAKQDPIDVDHKLDADLVNDASSTNKFVTATEKSQITTNANDIAAIKNGTTLNSFGDVETALAGITPAHLYRMHLKIGTDYAVIGITPTIDAFEVGQTYTVYDGTYRLTADQRTAMKKVLSGISGNETEVPFQLYGALVNKTTRTCIELTDFSGVIEVKLDFNSTSNNVYTAGGTWTLKFTQLT